MERRKEDNRKAHLERTKQDIAERLQTVCAGMPEAEFARLVERIATISIKYSTRRSEDMFKRAP